VRGYVIGLSRREEERKFYNYGLLLSLVSYSIITEFYIE